jgi:DNA polymerase-1
MTKLYIDFEFNGTTEKMLNLVCATTLWEGQIKEWWLHKDEEGQRELRNYLWSRNACTIVAYSAEAEARSFIALGLDPLKFQWLDLFLEYRMLQNHNHDLLHGKQLIDGKVKRTFPYGEKGKQSLAAAKYKLLGRITDTAHKEAMRQLIISTPEDFSEDERKSIMDYCTSDVVDLPDMLVAVSRYYPKVVPKQGLALLPAEARLRGEYAARTAKMVTLGYPVNLEWLHNFASNVSSVMETCIRDINRQFPQNPPFRYIKRTGKYSMTEKVPKDWIEKHHGGDWKRTDSGGISLALEAWTEKYHYSHEYPEGHMAAQMIRYAKLKQAMAGFKKDAEKTIFDFLGTDGRIRAHLNPYGAQSSRTQAKSSSFIFLKPAWQRALVQPPRGRAIAGIDWSSVEFLLSGLLSRDKKMLDAYASGDVYLAFGKAIGWIPKDGTKKTHKFERDVCKALVLGLSYMMSKYGLARKLTDDTGKVFTEDEAQELVEQFEETYADFTEWRREYIATYEIDRNIKLPCGWYMFGDNDNFRSVGNVGVQGISASILRRAVSLCQDRGLDVIFTLHDAIYIEYDSHNLGAIDTLKECMDEAFVYYFEGEMKEKARMIRCETETWSPDYLPARARTPKGFEVAMENLHLDERATKEWELYKHYMMESLGQELLA